MSCLFCQRLSQACPASYPSDDLRDVTPFSQWQTPQQLADDFGYNTQYILRLIRHPDVVSMQVDGRWYVLRCSFEQAYDRSTRLR
jgi:hypothetical protein